MREIKLKICNWCKELIPIRQSGRFKWQNEKFCNRECYMDWKRENPNKKPYKKRIIVGGYSYLYKPGHPYAIKGQRYVAEHRYAMEEKILRYLKPDEIVHHVDGNTLNNKPNNLELLTVIQHCKNNANSKRRDEYGKFTPPQV